jgi:hypothetical protein
LLILSNSDLVKDKRSIIYLEECVKRFFLVTIDFYLLEQLEVWNKTIPWPNILDAIEDFSSICSWFLLKSGIL